MSVLHLVPDTTGKLCDFCAAAPVFNLYLCRNFVFHDRPIFAHNVVGTWAACEQCAALIQTEQWSALVERNRVPAGAVRRIAFQLNHRAPPRRFLALSGARC